MKRDAKKIRVRGARAGTLAVALALCCATSAAAQTTAPATGAAAETAGGIDVASLPVCSTRVQGTLTLDQEDQETVTSAAFGRSTEPQPLTLVYRVAGCRVTDALRRPASPLLTGPVRTGGMATLPRGAVRIDDVDADGDRYVVHLRIQTSSDSPGADTVAPGSYTGFVRLKANWMHTVATPVTVTRSESDLLVPIFIGVLGSAAGFLLFWLARKIHDDNLLVQEQWVLWFTAAVSIVVGAGSAFFTNYLNQDVWTWSANGLALFTAAFSASTAGVAAGLLTGIYKTPSPVKAET